MSTREVLLVVSLVGGVIMAGVLIWQVANVEKRMTLRVGLFSVAIILLVIVELLYNKAVNEGVMKNLWP